MHKRYRVEETQQEAHGHIAHLTNSKTHSRKAMSSSHGYTMKLIKSKTNHIFILRTECPLLVKSWLSFTKGCFVPSLVEIGPVVLEKKNSLFRQFFFWKGHGPSVLQAWVTFIFQLAYKFEEVLNLVHCSVIVVNVHFALVHSVLGTTDIFNDVYNHNL